MLNKGPLYSQKQTAVQTQPFTVKKQSQRRVWLRSSQSLAVYSQA